MEIETRSQEIANAFGYLTQREVEALKLVALLLPPAPIIVNVGAGSGTSGLALAEARRDALIITVDISPTGPTGGLEGERNAFEGTNLKLPRQILGDSREVAKTWTEPLDMAFIDDGHLEPEIRGDILGWLPHIKEGGIIVFHDYTRKFWPDVKKVVDELIIPKYEKILWIDSLIAFKV